MRLKKIQVVFIVLGATFFLANKDFGRLWNEAQQQQRQLIEEAIEEGNSFLEKAEKEAKEMIQLAPTPFAKIVAYFRSRELIAFAKKEQKRILERAKKKGEATLFLLKEKESLSQ